MASYDGNSNDNSGGSYIHNQPGNYSEDVVPKYPDVRQNQEWLEVVPNQTPLYHLQTYEPLYTTSGVVERGEGKSPATDSPLGSDAATTVGGAKNVDERRRILGLTVPVFWALVLGVVIILAAGIGGGIGGGLMAQQQKSNSDIASGSSNPTPTTSSGGTASSPTSTAVNAALPSDSGCPQIEGQTYTPYAVNGQPIPFEDGLEGQQFRQQCYTNYVSAAATSTHDILRIFMPTLENCMMTCAEYNAGYRAGLKGGAGVGGGYCVAVSLDKESAGFCYLKNGTGANDTMGRPEAHSSAVLITDTNMQPLDS
ncbi:hypothetical protein F5X99DRAFT_370322 [Biscogniauxia marginata]|nr:hypothetical protein F5X99DRAFT_370322 [Biscogniauxia marginata]